MEKIKGITAIFLRAALGFTISYLCVAFIKFNANILEWGEIARTLLIIGTISFWIISILVNDEE